MRRLFLYLLLGSFVLSVAAPVALAQPAEGEEEEDASDPVEDEEDEEGEDDDDWGEEEDEPRLRAPQAETLSLGETHEEEEDDEDWDEEDEEDDEDDDELPDPAESQSRLDASGPDSDPTIARWTTPQTVLDLHGYFRFRGEFQENFFFGRVSGQDEASGAPGSVILPFRLFRPAEDEAMVCGSDGDARCNQHANAFANMRLRLEPSIHLSDDVRVRMQFDVFDNMVLGSTPNSLAYGPYQNTNRIVDPYYRYERTTMAPLDTASTTLLAPQAGVNSLQDSIQVRRAWAEVRNRTLGELRFGRMGSHWGLGMLANGGQGIDSDYQTDVDRIMLITRLAGITLFGAWDFASEGLLYQERADVGGLAFDRSRLDDTDQFVFGAAFRATDEERDAALQRGDAVFNVGAYFVYRSQNLTSAGTTSPLGLCVVCNSDAEEDAYRYADPVFVRRGAAVYVPDIWIQFLYENLRLEVEAAMVLGSIDNLSNVAYEPGESGPAANLLQFGIAFEGEYHLLNNQLGIYFNAGYASGDPDQEGLSQMGGLQPQLPAGPDGRQDTTYSTFAFHPNYRVDLIFWRTVLRQISGAYYFRPGLSYDFIRNSFGQLLGARADVIWSRASEPIQAWGNADDLAVEINVSAYYRSEDGPDILDGFFAMAQWGMAFPLDGVKWLPGSAEDNSDGNGVPLGNAQTFRLVLGVQY